MVRFLLLLINTRNVDAPAEEHPVAIDAVFGLPGVVLVLVAHRDEVCPVRKVDGRVNDLSGFHAVVRIALGAEPPTWLPPASTSASA